MTQLYRDFVTSIAVADRNASMIFLMACGLVVAWYAIDLLPAAWRNWTRLLGWLYCIVALVYTIVIST